MSFRSYITSLTSDWWLRHDAADLFGDSSGNNRDLTTTDGTATTGSGLASSGGEDSALLLAGGDTPCTTADAAGLAPTAGIFSMLLIAHLPGLDEEGIEWALYRTGGNGAIRLRFTTDGETRSAFAWVTSEFGSDGVLTRNFSGGGWGRALIRYDGTTLDMWLDGVRVGSVPYDGSALTGWASAHFRLSAGSTPTRWDEEVYWNRVLTNTEVRTIFSESGGFTPSSDVPFLVANDRHAVIACVAPGDATSMPEFRHWFAGPPPWTEHLAGLAEIPLAYTLDEYGLYSPGSLETSLFEVDDDQEVVIDGVLVLYVPRPVAFDEDIDSDTPLVFSAKVEVWGLPGVARDVGDGTTSGVTVIAAQTVTSTVGAGASDTWPNVRSVLLPLRENQRGRAARVILESIGPVRIESVSLMGTPEPMRQGR